MRSEATRLLICPTFSFSTCLDRFARACVVGADLRVCPGSGLHATAGAETQVCPGSGLHATAGAETQVCPGSGLHATAGADTQVCPYIDLQNALEAQPQAHCESAAAAVVLQEVVERSPGVI